MSRVAPWHQTNWDWRAAANFICGGTGTGMLIAAAPVFAPGAAYRLAAGIGLAFVAAGLFFVWLEIGKPWRAANVFRHPQMSWMTRESLVAPLLFACALAAMWTGAAAPTWAALALAAAFLYCQGRILLASKGIPAWRNPWVVELIFSTGLAEGTGLLLALAPFAGNVPRPGWVYGALTLLVVARALAWYAYRGRLDRDRAPLKTFAAFRRIETPFAVFGLWVPLLLLLVAIEVSARAEWYAALAGLCTLGSGWMIKFTLVARAAYNQGFALPKLPVRGAGKPGPATRPGWK